MSISGSDSGTGAGGGESVNPSTGDTGTGTSGESLDITAAETGTGVTGTGVADNPNTPSLGDPYIGGFPHACSPYGGGSIAEDDPPTVTVRAPVGAVTGGGPNLTVAWAYTQAQGVPQTSAVIEVLDQDAGGAVVWSQTLKGNAESVTFDALAAGLDANTTGGRYSAQVTVFAGNSILSATAETDFDLQWGQPTVTVTKPVSQGGLFAPYTDVAWTYSDTAGEPPQSYHVTLYDPTGRLVADGGTIRSPALSTRLYFFPINGSDYTLMVTVDNANGVPGSGTTQVVGDNPATVVPVGAPQLSEATERWYARLPAFMRDADEALNQALPLKSYMACLGEQQGAVEGLFDRFDWVPPNEGGPEPTSGLSHSRSDLVSPLSADDTWLPWLANVVGVRQADRSPAQWRVAMIPRPDPSGAFVYTQDPVTGQVGREPLMLYPYSAGSKGGVKQAVQDIFAESVSPVTLIAGSTIVNAGYAEQPVVARLLGASWSSPDGSALVVSTATGFEFVAQAPTMTVVADQTDSTTVAEFVQGEQYSFQLKLASPAPTGAKLTLELRGFDATVSNTVSLSDSVDGTTLAASAIAPFGVIEAKVTLVVSPATVGDTHTATAISTVAPIFTASAVGAAVFGLGVPTDTTVVDVLGPVSVELSSPAEFTVRDGILVVVPPVPVLVSDHWLGDPWLVNVAVPFGTDPSALTNTLDAQAPAGVTFKVTFGVLTWRTLYETYGDGTSATWLGIEGDPTSPRTWAELERQLT